MRRGTSLLEALLATAILGVLLTAVIYLFMQTRQQAVGSEARLSAVMLAQMVIEKVRSDLNANPGHFRTGADATGKWTYQGPVVEPLFPAGAAAIYKDHDVKITIEDDVDVETGGDGPLKELVKVVTVVVSRTGLASTETYRVSARVLTPLESLSLPALDALYKNFEGASLSAMWAEFFLTVKDNLYFSKNYLSLDSKKLLADCYIVLGATNTEAYLTEGQTVSGTLVFAEGKPQQTIDGWIALMGQPDHYRHAVFKKARAQLQTYKATVIFDAIKKLGPVLDHLVTEHEKILPKIEELTKLMQTSLDRLIQLNTDTLQAMGKYKEIEGDAKKGVELAKKGVPALTAEVKKLREDAERLLRDIDRERDERKRRERREAAAKKTAEAALRQRLIDRLSAGATVADIEKELLAPGDGQLAVMQQTNGAFADFTSTRARELMDILELVVLVSFVRDFFGEQNNRKIADRLAQYPQRFRATVDELEKSITDHLAQADGPTPAEHVGAALALAEVEKVRQLEANAADGPALARLTALGGTHAATTPPLSKYLTTGEVHDLESLRARNARFLGRLQQMKQLSRKYLEIAALYDQGGKIYEFLEVYTKLARELRLESDSIISKIQRQVSTLRGQLDTVGNMTKEEILSAMKSTDP